MSTIRRRLLDARALFRACRSDYSISTDRVVDRETPMTQLDLDPLRRIAAPVSALAWVLVLALGVPADAWARQAEPPPAANAARPAPDESLTVLGRRHHFEAAPVPGAPLGPPPDKPGPHLGRYKISGDQSARDGFDAQTGAFIAPFGSAYTGASPTAGGLASHFGH